MTSLQQSPPKRPTSYLPSHRISAPAEAPATPPFPPGVSADISRLLMKPSASIQKSD
uniref:Uncharacterized protein n=1 Tax=Anguilla anguilla TaxID=7936 RepID=A0A0E9S3K8_ANGAN